MDPDLCIVIVTHDSAAVIGRCLDGIGDKLAERVLVVDNASHDATREIARARGASVLAQDHNTGFGAAANAGARAAHATWLCFLNPDCEPTPELFGAGIAAIAARPLACAAPRLREGERVIPGCQPGYTALKLLADTLHSNYGGGFLWRRGPRWRRYHDPSWSWPHGACLFIAREDFLGLGGFDERHFLYMEDVDLGRRIARAGGEVLPLDVTLVHRAQSGANIGKARRLSLLHAARVRYAARHHGRVLAAGLALLALPAAARRALRERRP